MVPAFEANVVLKAVIAVLVKSARLIPTSLTALLTLFRELPVTTGVGALVGVLVGGPTGALVGTFVGAFVGAVGVLVGVLVGAGVGAVGVLVGVLVGAAVGVVDFVSVIACLLKAWP